MKKSTKLVFVILGMLLLAGLIALGYILGSKQNAGAPAVDQTKTSNQTTPKDDKVARSVSVYFSQSEADADFTKTVAVKRSTDRSDVATYLIEQLIAGPNATEQQQQLISPLTGKLTGDSNCQGKDFTLSTTDQVATLQFCKTVASAGVGDDARIMSTIKDTLLQLDTIDSVRILNQDGNCFNDASGQNQC